MLGSKGLARLRIFAAFAAQSSSSARLPKHLPDFSANSSSPVFKMKLDTKALRYLTSEDWRVLTAVCLTSLRPPQLPN